MDSDPIITVHYSEIALKGRNKSEFEKALINNIKRSLGRSAYDSISKKSSRLIIRLKPNVNTELITSKLKKIFGIKWFAIAFSIPKDIELLKDRIVKMSSTFSGKTIKVDTRRVDKNFLPNSLEVNRIIGAELAKAGFKVDLTKPEVKIFIEILKDEILVSFDKIRGLGGLPVGTSGRVISFLSGGIDSPVAAWLMMKRGCRVDFLHLAADQEFENIKSSKIIRLLKILKEYSSSSSVLYVAPYTEFYKKIFLIPARSRLVVFRRFLLRLGERIALENGYLGIVTGDNLAQVASQTLENLHATGTAAVQVYRPLISYDKDDIIELAKAIGTYETSIEKYKDCCALVTVKHPSTRTKLSDVENIEREIGMEEVVEKTIAAMKKIII